MVNVIGPLDSSAFAQSIVNDQMRALAKIKSDFESVVGIAGPLESGTKAHSYLMGAQHGKPAQTLFHRRALRLTDPIGVDRRLYDAPARLSPDTID